MRLYPSAVGLALVAAATFNSSCGNKDQPAAPTTAATPVPVAGTPLPTPTPTPTPTPAEGRAQSQSCERLTAAFGGDGNCRSEGTHVHESIVQSAVMGSRHLEGGEIVYYGGFKDEVVKTLDAQGICARFESDNLFVRGVGDEYNEYYDVITSTGFAGTRYTNTCRPPVTTPELPPVPPVRDPECKLPPSLETICGEDEEQYFGDEVRGAIDAVAADERAKPTSAIFDFSETRGGPEGFKVLDFEAYHAAVIKKLHVQGFCGWFDGEDLQVKNSNQFSAHWDIIKAEGYRIQLWAGVCRDAAF